MGSVGLWFHMVRLQLKHLRRRGKLLVWPRTKPAGLGPGPSGGRCKPRPGTGRPTFLSPGAALRRQECRLSVDGSRRGQHSVEPPPGPGHLLSPRCEAVIRADVRRLPRDCGVVEARIAFFWPARPPSGRALAPAAGLGWQAVQPWPWILRPGRFPLVAGTAPGRERRGARCAAEVTADRQVRPTVRW